LDVASEEAQRGFPYLQSHPSSAARKWLSAFRSFPEEDQVKLAPLLVWDRFHRLTAMDQDFDDDSLKLLNQMLARVRHVPKAVLDTLASKPTRSISGWDESVWEASHVNLSLRVAAKRDVSRAVLAELRKNAFRITRPASAFYVVSGPNASRSLLMIGFGGLWQVRISANAHDSDNHVFKNITLPFCLGYVVDGYNEILPDGVQQAAAFAIHELLRLENLLERAAETTPS
jgi:hypothetical protein